METMDERERQRFALQNFIDKLNREPNPTEFDKTPDGKASYLPISFIEMTLDELFFGQWSTENFKWSAITNEVQGSLELVVLNPINGSHGMEHILTEDKVFWKLFQLHHWASAATNHVVIVLPDAVKFPKLQIL